jgi:hypothetical protein
MSWLRKLFGLGKAGSLATVVCPKCGLVVEGDFPDNALFICVDCNAVFHAKDCQGNALIASGLEPTPPEIEKYEVDERYTDLRQQILTTPPSNLGLTASPSSQVWAVLMEMGTPEAIVTLLTIADGTVSLYFSNGGGIIGVGQHEGPRKACLKLLAAAPDYLQHANPTLNFPLPILGRTQFYFMTFIGAFKAEAAEADLEKNLSPLSPFYYQAQNVITEARLAEERTRGKRAGKTR